MFELPNSKRVCRSDLYTRSQSASPVLSELDPELEAQLESHFTAIYGSALGFAPGSAATQPRPAIEQAEQDAEQEFEFRLFSGPTGKDEGSSVEVQKILLNDDADSTAEREILKRRDPRVWVARKAEGERLDEFKNAAITGEEVLRRRELRSWGLEVPWRVMVLKSVGKAKGNANLPIGTAITEAESIESKRKRPGKKRRVLLRQRKKKIDELVERKRKETEAKEESEKEKRTRRNREKKVKKKMKEKAKKSAGDGVLTSVLEGSTAGNSGNQSEE